jgi:uncharacterized protein YegL
MSRRARPGYLGVDGRRTHTPAQRQPPDLPGRAVLRFPCGKTGGVSIVTFGPVSVACDFTGIQHFVAPTLRTTGDTPMGEAIEKSLEILRNRKAAYKANGISYYRPWVFLITDGSPTDSVANAAKLLRAGEQQKSFMFFAVGVEGADFEQLRSVSVREPLKLRGLQFNKLFQWLSASLSTVSRSRPTDAPALSNPAAPGGWAVAG